MKSITQFVRATLTGGIIFLLPVVLLLMLFAKAHAVLLKISTPIADKLPEIILGLDGSNLVTILLLILICFISGLLFRSLRVQKWVGVLEDNVLIYTPGYSLIKSITADTLVGPVDHNMNLIMVQDGYSWRLGF